MKKYNWCRKKVDDKEAIENNIFKQIKLLKGNSYQISQYNPYSITFVISGKISYKKDENSLSPILDDKLAIMIDNLDISLFAIEDSEIIICNLANNLKIQPCFGHEIGLNEDSACNCNTVIIEINSLIHVFLSSIDLYTNMPPNCFNYQELKRLELLILLKIRYPQSRFSYLLPPEDLPEFNFRSLILNNYKTVKNVKELANLTNTSMSTFTRKFKLNFGMSFSQWKKSHIANNVYREIKFTTKSFKNIAVENNFSSQAHFNRFCKKQYGKTPGELRNLKDYNKLY